MLTCWMPTSRPLLAARMLRRHFLLLPPCFVLLLLLSSSHHPSLLPSSSHPPPLLPSSSHSPCGKRSIPTSSMYLFSLSVWLFFLLYAAIPPTLDGWADGWMDGCLDGWMDGRMDEWMDRRMDTVQCSTRMNCAVRGSKHALPYRW